MGKTAQRWWRRRHDVSKSVHSRQAKVFKTMQARTDRVKSLASVGQFRIGALLVQPDRLTVITDGLETALEPRLMEVLVALAEHAGEVVSADQLLIEVWQGTFYGDNPVHRAIAQLRRLIGDSSRTPRYIETIRKRGYRLIARVLFPDDFRRSPSPAAPWTKGNPYVGLASFDNRHAGVFFGRSRMIAELLTALRRQIDSRRRFVLLVGASGSGKTSLLRAGAIPLLMQDGGFDGMQSLAVGYCDLAGCRDDGDVFLQLATALSAWTLEQRPVFAPQSAAKLAEHLRRRPEMVDEAIADAFLKARKAAPAGRTQRHFLLVIDHGETLVAAPGIVPAERDALSRVLLHLCNNPRAAVMMIVRSDFYPRLIEAIPTIADLKSGHGHVDVLKPRPGEIAQIIRAPALLAGLVFEEDAETAARLDDTLRDAALEHADALPLLQHALHTLYERRTDAGELSFASYNDIGGLIGALAHRAEEVFAGLPATAQQCLDRVLALLVVIQPDSESVSAQRALWSALDDEPSRLLAENFIRARLFVGELINGRPAIGVAHEALLRQWPRARDWAQENRRLLQARARLQRATARWVQEGKRQDHLLNPGQPLIEAREVARRVSTALDKDELEFLQACERQYRHRQWLRVGALAALVTFSGVSVLFGLRAQYARNEAELHRKDVLQLADFMLVDLAEKLRPLGNLSLLGSIGTAALSHLERRPEEAMHSEDLINHSRALRTIGEVMMEQAKLEMARSAFVRATTAAGSALAQSPDSTDALAEQGVAAYWLGYYFYRQHRLDEANAHWATYLHASQRLMELEPDNLRWSVELSYALNNLGTVARDTGQIDVAVDYFRRSATLKKSALDADPDNAALRFDLIDTLSWISSGDESQGRLAVAAEGYAEQLLMLRALVADHPNALAWERRLATSLMRSASLAMARGNLELAHRQIDESIWRLSTLVGHEPDNRVWLRDLAHARLEAARISGLRDDRAGALAHLEVAQTLTTALLKSPQPPPEWQRLDALVRLRSAQSQTDPVHAGADLSRVVSDLKALADQAPGDLSAMIALAQALIARGQWHASRDLVDEARKDWLTASDLLQTPAVESHDRALLDPWVSAQLLLGRRSAVAAQIARLEVSGYRQPEFNTLLQSSMSHTGDRNAEARPDKPQFDPK